MNKVINQRRYDTKTATELADYDNGHNQDDFDYWSEALYRTKSGNYFLYCYGGPNSRHGEWHGNTGGWGRQIKPIGLAEAQEWG